MFLGKPQAPFSKRFSRFVILSQAKRQPSGRRPALSGVEGDPTLDGDANRPSEIFARCPVQALLGRRFLKDIFITLSRRTRFVSAQAFRHASRDREWIVALVARPPKNLLRHSAPPFTHAKKDSYSPKESSGFDSYLSRVAPASAGRSLTGKVSPRDPASRS